MPMTIRSRPFLGEYTWAALQASAFANGGAALAAMPKSTEVFITDLGDGVTLSPDPSGAYWTKDGYFTLDKFGATTLNSLTGCNSALTWAVTGAGSSGSYTRIQASGAHGITSAMDGKCVYISSWPGGPGAGYYVLTYVNSTDIDLTLTYSAGYNATVPVVTPINTETLFRSVAVPAGLMQIYSSFRISTEWLMTSSANNKYCTIKLNTREFLQIAPQNVSGLHDMRIIRNRGSLSSQIAQAASSAAFAGASPQTGSENLANAATIGYYFQPQPVNTFVELASAILEAKI